MPRTHNSDRRSESASLSVTSVRVVSGLPAEGELRTKFLRGMGCRYHAAFTFRGRYFTAYELTEAGARAAVIAQAADAFDLPVWKVAPPDSADDALDFELAHEPAPRAFDDDLAQAGLAVAQL